MKDIKQIRELKSIVEASAEAKAFYYDIIISESKLALFFGGDKAKKLSNKIDTYVDEQLNETPKTSYINFKPIVRFAIAASMAALYLVKIWLMVYGDHLLNWQSK